VTGAQSGRGSDRRRPRLVPLRRKKAANISILLAAGAVALLASFVTWHLNAGLPHERRARDALEQIRLDAVQLQALESRLISTGRVEASDTLASELILDDMATQGREVAGLHQAGGTVLAVRALIAAFRQLTPALAARNRSLANQIYRTRYLPARIRLQQVVLASDRAAKRRLETSSSARSSRPSPRSC